MDLQSKHIIVTGVSKGIGLATVKMLLGKGALVAGWGRKSPPLDHPDFHFFKTDMSQIDEVNKSFENTRVKLGNVIHGIVNNAGFGFFKNLEDIPPDKWTGMFDVNVHGIYYALRCVIPVMKEQGFGHIINISSTAGKNGIVEATAYSGTKWAVRGISLSLYREVKRHNIKVTCIFPGSVNTGFFEFYDGITANESMLHVDDIALAIVQAFESSDNVHIPEIEIRPLNAKYR